jgi:hypothetical protein
MMFNKDWKCYAVMTVNCIVVAEVFHDILFCAHEMKHFKSYFTNTEEMHFSKFDRTDFKNSLSLYVHHVFFLIKLDQTII